MPLYEYQCKKCAHRFEKIQQFSDAPVKKCPECGGAVERLISAPAVQFKGSGWYVTDYAGKSRGSEKSKSADSEGSSSSSNEKDGGKATEKSEGKKKEASKETKAKK